MDLPDMMRMTVSSLQGTDFQLEDYSMQTTPIVTNGIGRTGTTVRIEGSGWVQENDAESFIEETLGIQSALNVSGADVRIFGLSYISEVELLAAQCVSGGPHISCKMMPQLAESPLRKRFEFAIDAVLPGGPIGPGGDGTISGFKDKTAATPDALRTIERTGTLIGSGSDFLASVLPGFRSLFPASGWVISHEYQTDNQDLSVNWTITATQLFAPYPDSGADAQIVDGEGTIEKNRDEQKRLSQVFAFDFLLSDGDPQTVLDLIRQEAAALGSIIRESSRVTRYKQLRLQASFELLLGAEGNDLLNYSQEFHVTDATSTWTMLTFPGADPILVEAPAGTRILTQSGSATSRGDPFRPPTPLYPDTPLQPWDVTFSAIDDFEIVTRWVYVMAADNFSPFEPPNGILDNLYRPTDPQFITIPDGES